MEFQQGQSNFCFSLSWSFRGTKGLVFSSGFRSSSLL